MTWCIVNGHMVLAADAFVSVQDRGFRYGDGVFETIAVRDGVPYQFDWHMVRLANGLHAVKIPFVTDSLREHCRQLLRKNAVNEAILRIQITRGVGSRGYLPDWAHSAGATFVIETSPMPAIQNDPVALWISHYTRISARALPVQYKLCQGLNSTLARIEATENDCAEALLLNEQGQLCETSSGNLFWFKGGTLYTPSLRCGVLKGATRAAVMRLSPYPVHEVETGIEALMQAEAVFITNTVWKTLAVSRLLPHEIFWDSKEITEQFCQLLEKDRGNYRQMYGADW